MTVVDWMMEGHRNFDVGLSLPWDCIQPKLTTSEDTGHNNCGA